MDTEKLKKLIADREAIDAEIVALVNGGTVTATNGAKRERAAQKCSKCGSDSHNARACTAEQTLPGVS